MGHYQVLHVPQSARQAGATQPYSLTGQVLWPQLRLANTLSTRLVGLLTRHELAPHEGLWITPCNSIHSIGMRFEFDAAFLSAQGEILHVITAMRPWRCSPLVRQAVAVLEVGAHSLAAHQVHLGDTLHLLPVSP
jgi:uncharacterized protein